MALLDQPLWRGVLCLPGDPEPEVLLNLQALRSEVVPEGIDAHLLRFLGSLRDRTGYPAPFSLTRQHYTDLALQGDANGVSGTIRLDDIEQAGLPFLPPVEYRYALDRFRERVLGDGLANLLHHASSILTTGYTYTPPKQRAPVTLQGPMQALAYLDTQCAQLAQQFRSDDLEGTLRDLGATFSRYQRRRGRPTTGILSGFSRIDDKHDGFKPGDLALLLGFTGQMKSIVVLNLAYRAAIYQGKNVALYSMEASVKGLQDTIVVMHTYHPKFAGRLAPTGAPVTVTYDKLVRGQLAPYEETLVEEAIADLATDRTYGTLVYKEPAADLKVNDVRSWCEQQDAQTPLDLLVLDYAGFLNPNDGGNAMAESAYANVMVRQLKQMAMTFAKGRGLAVVSPWQSNREGFKEAEKNGGVYNLRALAWAPEAEKSADLVYFVYRNEVMAKARQIQLGNLKARDRELLTVPLMVFADPAIRIVEEVDTMKTYQQVVAF